MKLGPISILNEVLVLVVRIIIPVSLSSSNILSLVSLSGLEECAILIIISFKNNCPTLGNDSSFNIKKN